MRARSRARPECTKVLNTPFQWEASEVCGLDSYSCPFRAFRASLSLAALSWPRTKCPADQPQAGILSGPWPQLPLIELCTLWVTHGLQYVTWPRSAGRPQTAFWPLRSRGGTLTRCCSPHVTHSGLGSNFLCLLSLRKLSVTPKLSPSKRSKRCCITFCSSSPLTAGSRSGSEAASPGASPGSSPGRALPSPTKSQNSGPSPWRDCRLGQDPGGHGLALSHADPDKGVVGVWGSFTLAGTNNIYLYIYVF